MGMILHYAASQIPKLPKTTLYYFHTSEPAGSLLVFKYTLMAFMLKVAGIKIGWTREGLLANWTQTYLYVSYNRSLQAGSLCIWAPVKATPESRGCAKPCQWKPHIWGAAPILCRKSMSLKSQKAFCHFFWQQKSSYWNVSSPRCPILVGTMSESSQSRAINLGDKGVTVWLELMWHLDKLTDSPA